MWCEIRAKVNPLGGSEKGLAGRGIFSLSFQVQPSIIADANVWGDHPR